MALIPGQLILPAHQVPFGLEQQLRATLGARLEALVQKVGGNAQGTLIYRQLLAEDIQSASASTRMTNANATSLSTSTFVSMFAGSSGFTLPVNQAIGLYGFMEYEASPLVDQIKFFLGASGTPLSLINACEIYRDNRVTCGYFEPMLWKPQDIMDVQLRAFAAVAQNVSSFQLLGLIAEPIGLNITPRSDLDNLVPQ